METINPTPLIVVGTALVITSLWVLFRYLRKKWIMKKQLKEAVVIIRQKVETKEEEWRFLWMSYQEAIQVESNKMWQISKSKEDPVKFIVIDDNIKMRIVTIEEKTKELTTFFTPSPRWPWKRWAKFWYEIRIPKNLLKPPRLTIDILQDKLEKLNNLLRLQKNLIAAFKRALNKPWRNEQGKIINVSKIELYFGEELVELEKKEKEAKDVKNTSEMEVAVAKLEAAIRYVNTRQLGKSIGIGENSIIGNAHHLNFESVENYSKEARKKVIELHAKGSEATSIIDFCLAASLNLKQNFEDWAKIIYGSQVTFDKAKQYLDKLGEHRKTEIIACKKYFDRIMTLFQDTIPDIWGIADWESLEICLDDVDRNLSKINALTTNLVNHAETIENLEVRIQDTLTKEDQLEELSGRTFEPLEEWVNALASWENDVIRLWANGEHDELETVLSSLDQALANHSYGVKNRLYETVRDSGGNIEKEASFEKARKSFLVQKDTSTKPPEITPTEIPFPNGQERNLSGTEVRLQAPFSDDIVNVDSSHVSQMLAAGYKRVDPEEEINTQSNKV